MASPERCPHCFQPLPTLARLRGLMHCAGPVCRAEHERRGAPARRERHDRLARQELARRWPSDADAPKLTVWLEPHARPRLVKPLPAERLAFEQHLLAAAAGRPLSPGVVVADPAPAAAAEEDSGQPRPADVAAAEQQGRLCGHCGGRCCRIGLAAHAFIDTPLLERWVARQPGSGPGHAIQAYIARLPERHVQGSCLFHGAQGCNLPRDERSAVCNRFACDALQQLQQAQQVQDRADGPGPAVIAFTGLNGHASRAAFIAAEGPVHPLKIAPP
jgi:hypothetical protein